MTRVVHPLLPPKLYFSQGNLLKNENKQIMGKFLKTGKVVLLLHGRFAGKKAVIVQSSDVGTKERKYGHSLVAGIDRVPKKVCCRSTSSTTHFPLPNR